MEMQGIAYQVIFESSLDVWKIAICVENVCSHEGLNSSHPPTPVVKASVILPLGPPLERICRKLTQNKIEYQKQDGATSVTNI